MAHQSVTQNSYTSVMGLQQSRDLDIKEVLIYELFATPPGLCDENGDTRSQNKAMLKSKLQVQVSNRHIEYPDAILIDGCALLWVIHWPSLGTVEYFIKNFLMSLHFYLQQCRVLLIFDRYRRTSTKSATRSNRTGNNGSRNHLLTLSMPYPHRKYP